MHWGRGVDSRGKGGRGGGEKGCPQMPHHFLWLCLSMGVRKGRSDRTGVEEVRAVRGHPSSPKAKRPAGARQPEGIRGHPPARNPRTPVNPCEIRGPPTVRRHPQSWPSPGKPRNPRGKTADTHVSRRKKSAAAANPQPPADGNGEASCATAYRTLGLQRRESAEGPRPRCPSFFSFPPALRLSTGGE